MNERANAAWIPISRLKEYIKGREMFVVRGFDVNVGSPMPYTTDPYCVWFEEGIECFVRWPHTFMPTHFCMLPLKEQQ